MFGAEILQQVILSMSLSLPLAPLRLLSHRPSGIEGQKQKTNFPTAVNKVYFTTAP